MAELSESELGEEVRQDVGGSGIMKLSTSTLCVASTRRTSGSNRDLSREFSRKQPLNNYAAAILVGHYIYIVGKCDHRFKLAYLNTRSWKWYNWPQHNSGIHLYGSQMTHMVLIKDSIYVFQHENRTAGRHPHITARRSMSVLDLVMKTESRLFSNDGKRVLYSESEVAYIENRDLIVAFGSRSANENIQLYGYVVATNVWTPLKSKGEEPRSVSGLVCCTYGDRDIFYTGSQMLARNFRMVPDRALYRLSCELNEFVWSRISLDPGPQRLTISSLCCIGNRVFSFGGYRTANMRMPASHLIVYDVNSGHWKDFGEYANAQREVVESELDLYVSGKLSHSSGHMSVAASNVILILGGRDSRANQILSLSAK